MTHRVRTGVPAAMDKLIERLEGHRKQWEAAGKPDAA